MRFKDFLAILFIASAAIIVLSVFYTCAVGGFILN